MFRLTRPGYVSVKFYPIRQTIVLTQFILQSVMNTYTHILQCCYDLVTYTS